MIVVPIYFDIDNNTISIPISKDFINYLNDLKEGKVKAPDRTGISDITMAPGEENTIRTELTLDIDWENESMDIPTLFKRIYEAASIFADTYMATRTLPSSFNTKEESPTPAIMGKVLSKDNTK